MFAFSVYFALRFDVIQNEADPLYPLAEKYRADAFTVHLKPDYSIPKAQRCEVETLDEIGNALEEIEGLLREYIFPFFSSCSDLAAVERLLNRYPGKPATSNMGARAITGVVAAALCRRSDFSEIVARYRDVLGRSTESIRKQFEAAVVHATTNILNTK